MAKYRMTMIDYWNDPYIERLSKDGKLLYIYLITSPHTNNIGILEITLDRISYETKIDIKELDQILNKMETDKKVVRDGDIIWIVNFMKCQGTTSPMLKKHYCDDVKNVVSEKILNKISKKYPELNITLRSSAEQHPNTPSTPSTSPTNTVSASSSGQQTPIQKREFEKEGECEGERELKGERELEGELEGEGELNAPPHNSATAIPSDDGSLPSHQSTTALSAGEKSKVDNCPHEKIIALYHEILPKLPRVQFWHENRKKMLRDRWQEDKSRQNLDWWRGYFTLVAASDFLCGQNSRGFMADLEWLINPNNMPKVLEGRYTNRTPNGNYTQEELEEELKKVQKTLGETPTYDVDAEGEYVPEGEIKYYDKQ